MRVAIYTRVSTSSKGQTVENQRGPLLDYCEAQGWHDAVEYTDEASAADLRGRKGWRKLLEDASKRRFDLLLVWKMDRMARSVLDAANVLEQFRSWGVGLRSYSEPYLDTTSPFGEAMFHITMAYAALERDMLRERTRAGLERAKRQGKQIGRPKLTSRPEVIEKWKVIGPEVKAGSMSISEAARRMKLARSSVRELLKVAETGV